MYTIYSKSDCIYCKRAKDLLDLLDETYVEYSIEHDNNRAVMNSRLMYEARTVPQIWEDDKYIGGFTELAVHVK